MDNLNNLFTQATGYHQSNQLEMAKQIYQQILQNFSNHPDALHLLGVVYSQQNNQDQALEYFRKAININKHPMYFNNLGECLRLKGLYDGAESSFYQAISLAPNFAEAYFNLANVFKLQNKINKAFENYNVVLNINPNHFKALFSLGNIMLEQNQFDNAINYYDQSIRLNPNFVDAIHNKNIALKSMQDKKDNFEKAISNYKQNIINDPNDYISYVSLGKLFYDNGMYTQSLENYQASLNINKDKEEIYNDMANIFTKLNEWDKVTSCYQESIKINSNSKIIHQKLAKAFEKLGNIEEAKKCYYNLSKFESNSKLIEFFADTLEAPISYNKEEVIKYQENLSKSLDKYQDDDLGIDLLSLHEINLRIPFCLVYQGNDDLEIRKKYANIFDKALSKYIDNQSISEKVNDKPHLAFLITKSHEGIFMTCMKGIVNNLSNDKFNITIICNQENYNEIIKPNLKNININFISLPERIDLAISVIKQANIDLLYYWEVGTDSINYLLSFFRLAKVQCTSYGWSVTTAVPNMDYYISSKTMWTDETDNQFTEKLILVDSLLAYYFKTPLPKQFMPKSYFGFSENDKIYICTQNLLKIQPDFDKVTLEILKRDPKAIYLLFEDHDPATTNLLKKRLKDSHGNFYDRIKFYPRIMRGPDYINLVKVSDVMLDTFYCGGFNTAYDAFSVGTPVVTLPSKFQTGRYTYALYKKMDINECIAKNEEDFIQISIRLANDWYYRQQISNNILERVNVLFQDLDAVKEISNAFEKMIGYFRNNQE